MRKILVAAAFLALILTACEFDTEITVRSDGSGTMTRIVGVDKTLLAMAGQDPLPSVVEALKQQAPIPVTVEQYSTDKLAGIKMSFSFSSAADFNDKYKKVKAEGEDATKPPTSTATLEKTPAAGWRFRFTSSEAPVTHDNLASMFGENGPPPNIDIEQIRGSIDVEFRITLPGRMDKGNATLTSTSGGNTTFTWKVPATMPNVDFTAATKAPSKFPIVPVAAGGGGAVLIAILGVVAMRRKAAAVPAPLAAGPSWPSEGPPPPPPAT